MGFEGVADVFEVEAEAFCLDGEGFQMGAEEGGGFGAGGLRGALGDEGAAAGLHGEEAIALEGGDDLVRGIGIDAELFAQGADAGEGVAGAELAGDDGLVHGIKHLLGDRLVALETYREGKHGVLAHTRTPGTVQGFLHCGAPLDWRRRSRDSLLDGACRAAFQRIALSQA